MKSQSQSPSFELPLDCKPFLVGSGAVEPIEAGVRLALPSAAAKSYSDAQLDDYSQRGNQLAWQPPVRMTLCARFSPGQILGTAGFGFWNNLFTPLGGLPALPRAAWFFYASPPSNMALAEGVPGHGWKAACIDATRPAAMVWAPLAPAVIALNQISAARARLWPRVQRALRICEAMLDAPMDAWHDYELLWENSRVTFRVNGAIVMQTDRAPRGPMGFVAWIDNQYAVVTPRGRFGWGLLDAPSPQWIEISKLKFQTT